MTAAGGDEGAAGAGRRGGGAGVHGAGGGGVAGATMAALVKKYCKNIRLLIL